MAAWAELGALLARERAAALAADLDALERIQIEKAALIEACALDRDGDGSSEAVDAMIAQARANVRLLRQLSDLHRALAGHDPIYTPRGGLCGSGPDGVRVRRAT